MKKTVNTPEKCCIRKGKDYYNTKKNAHISQKCLQEGEYKMERTVNTPEKCCILRGKAYYKTKKTYVHKS